MKTEVTITMTLTESMEMVNILKTALKRADTTLIGLTYNRPFEKNNEKRHLIEDLEMEVKKLKRAIDLFK